MRLLPLVEFTYNAAKHKAIGMVPFEADIGYIPRLPLDLLAPDPRRLDSEEGLAYAEKLSKTLRMLCERMEETQVAMTTEANEKWQAHPFWAGDEVFLDTRLLPIGSPTSWEPQTTATTLGSSSIRTRDHSSC